MPKKELDPLSKTSKEIDVVRKEVESTLKECNKILSSKKPTSKEKLNALLKTCFDYKQDVNHLRSKVDDLHEDKGREKVKNYENKKKNELKKLDTLMSKLSNTMKAILPDCDEEEYARILHVEDDATNATIDAEQAEGSEYDDEVEDDDVDNEDSDKEAEDEELMQDEEDDDYENGDSDGERKDDEIVKREMSLRLAEDKEDATKTVVVEKMDLDEPEMEDEDEDNELVDEEVEEEDVEEEDVLDDEVKDEDGVEDEVDEEEEEDEEDVESDDEENGEEEVEGKVVDDADVSSDVVDKNAALVQMSDIANIEHLRWITLDDYNGDDDDLSFKKGDLITVLEVREDGWWLAEDERGHKGLVPMTYLQMYDTSDDQNEEVEDELENGDGCGDVGERRGSKGLWSSLREIVTERTPSSLSDVLHALGAVPSGFRSSSLAPKQQADAGELFSMANYLSVKLSHSNLAYRDLFINPATSKIRPYATRIEHIVTILSCQQIPPPGAGVEVVERMVKLCLFDGSNILSNIHCVKVNTVDKSHSSWSFSSKVSDSTELTHHAELFVRTNNICDNIGILFELCISTVRSSNNEMGIISCGWSHLPLLETNGSVIHNRTVDMHVNGGAPHEKGVEVDPSISRRTNRNALLLLMSANKQPRLVVRISTPRKENKDYLDTMPDPLIGTTSLLPLYSLYRQVLADVLLRDRLDLDSTEIIHSPFLSLFPRVADHMDLMLLLKSAWMEKLKFVSRIEKRDGEHVKQLFCQTFMETIYLVYHVDSLPAYQPDDRHSRQVRNSELARLKDLMKNKNSPVAMFLSPDVSFRPFDMEEITFDVFGLHCLDKADLRTRVP